MSSLKMFLNGILPLLITPLAWGEITIGTPSPLSQKPVVIRDRTRKPDELYSSILAEIQKVPGGKRMACMVKDFAEILQPKSYGSGGSTQVSNVGLDQHYADLAKNDPVFGQQLYNFYSEINRVKIVAAVRTNINNVAGDKQNLNAKPGWLWEVALKNAAGNPNRAMQLIGACGHDDISHEINVARTKQELDELTSTARKLLASSITKWQAKLSAATAQPKNHSNRSECSLIDIGVVSTFLPALGVDSPYLAQVFEPKACADVKSIRLQIEEFQRLEQTLAPSNFSSQKLIACPVEDSKFFLAGSLGQKTDISAGVKARVIGTSDLRCKNNIDPASCIPAKAYHVLGSAAVACEMIEKGYDPKDVVKLSEVSAWYYRAYWLSGIVDKVDSLTRVAGQDNQQTQMNRIIAFLKNGNQQSCDLEPKSAKAGETLEIGANQHPNIVDAVALLKRWTANAESNGQLKMVGMDSLFTNLLSLQGDLGVHDTTKNLVKPIGWSKDRYENARNEVKSILTDFAWTIEQHKVGAEFAASVCKKDPKVAASSCKAK